MGVKRLAALAICLSVVGCAPGHCRRKIDPPSEAVPIDASPSPARADKLTSKDRVLVYKYDGGAQCDGSRLISLDEMAKELKGIPILSREKRNDHLQHILSCGGSTGNANVYEISAKYLNRAEGLGFRRWTYE